MSTNISRARIVLAGLVLAGGISSSALSSADPADNEKIARCAAGLPAKLPTGWRRQACSEVLGEQVFTLEHVTGEKVCFLRNSSGGDSAIELLQRTMYEVKLTPVKTGIRRVGGLEMVYARGEGLWTPDATAKVKQMRGIILLPNKADYLQISSTNSRRSDYRFRSTEVLLDSIASIPV